jgi:single-strand DNA-binding protein
MAKTLNRVELLGNMGKPVEVRATHGGTLVASFSLATVNRFKNNAGEWAEDTEWHSCVAFGRLAEILRDYTNKGSKLFVEGRLRTRSWEDRDTGKKQYRTDVLLSDVTLLDPRPRGESSGRVGGEDGTRGYTPATTPDEGITDDDIPF